MRNPEGILRKPMNCPFTLSIKQFKILKKNVILETNPIYFMFLSRELKI